VRDGEDVDRVVRDDEDNRVRKRIEKDAPGRAVLRGPRHDDTHAAPRGRELLEDGADFTREVESEEEPRIGVDPDICVLTPAPPRGGEDLRSVRTWKAGHAPPLVAVEVVSNTDPRKDYDVALEKYAASGTRELWIFDPQLAGPRSQGGPHLLQVWERNDAGGLERVFAGDGPAYSNALSAHLVVVGEPRRLRIADDPSGGRLWPTEADVEREAKERALARIAELEAELAKK
jgi:hypothetical protein